MQYTYIHKYKVKQHESVFEKFDLSKKQPFWNIHHSRAPEDVPPSNPWVVKPAEGSENARQMACRSSRVPCQLIQFSHNSMNSKTCHKTRSENATICYFGRILLLWKHTKTKNQEKKTHLVSLAVIKINWTQEIHGLMGRPVADLQISKSMGDGWGISNIQLAESAFCGLGTGH